MRPQTAPRPAEPNAAPLSDKVRSRGLLFIAIAAGCVGLTLTLQMSLNNNFLVGEIGRAHV
jgi:hypothetical protein